MLAVRRTACLVREHIERGAQAGAQLLGGDYVVDVTACGGGIRQVFRRPRRLDRSAGRLGSHIAVAQERNSRGRIHHADHRIRQSQRQVSPQRTGAEQGKGGAVCLAGHSRHLRAGRAGISGSQLAQRPRQSGIGAHRQSGVIHQRQNRQREGVAEIHKARRLGGTGGSQPALIGGTVSGNHTHGHTAHAAESDRQLLPAGGATRAQVAAIFQRYLEDDTAPVDPEGETVQLKIGKPENLKTVEAAVDDVTPDNVIAALAAETGWNLDLANPVSVDEDGITTVAFAADSGVYGEPPEPQKDAYHVYDVEDWIYTVFNSVAESLQANGATYVCFTAPDGGKLVIDNGDVHFYLMPTFRWDYEAAYTTNHVSDDSLGVVVLAPDGPTMLGVNMISFYVMKDEVNIEGGTLTIYDGNGDVYATVDLVDENYAIIDEALAEAEFDDMSAWYNADALSVVSVTLDETLPEGGVQCSFGCWRSE